MREKSKRDKNKSSKTQSGRKIMKLPQQDEKIRTKIRTKEKVALVKEIIKTKKLKNDKDKNKADNKIDCKMHKSDKRKVLVDKANSDKKKKINSKVMKEKDADNFDMTKINLDFLRIQ